MWDTEQKEVWEELKDIWKKQSGAVSINLQISELITDFKAKISQFEKDSIKKDITFVKASTSQFEKDAIKRDIRKFTTLINGIIDRFKKK